MPKIRIEVDADLCMGAGECVYSARHTFALNDESKAIVLNPTGDDTNAVLLAVRGCPNFAIKAFSDDEPLT